jgi:hypothetical protein
MAYAKTIEERGTRQGGVDPHRNEDWSDREFGVWRRPEGASPYLQLIKQFDAHIMK